MNIKKELEYRMLLHSIDDCSLDDEEFDPFDNV
jgi:hypothetical protein